MSTTVLDGLVAALQGAVRYNRNEQVAPAAVLWTDKGQVWESVIPLLRDTLPVLTLGAYKPEDLTGPAIWLRCVIAGVLTEPQLLKGTPILYLPGVSRQDLRAIEDCPKALQPLAELQYRGVFFTQKNARDWTPSAFLQAELEVRVAEDQATRASLERALAQVMRESVSTLKAQAPLRAAFFNQLLNPDPVRQLLAWLNQPDAVRQQAKESNPAGWTAFCDTCQKDYGFDPMTDGEVIAAEKLGKRQGAWATVWERFAESPRKYPNLPDLLRRAKPTQSSLFEHVESWPQDNEAEETRLCDALLALKSKATPEARTEVHKLAEEHGHRRHWVWAELGMAPLANALNPLTGLLKATRAGLGAGTPQELAERYASGAWQADNAALLALAAATTLADGEALKAAVKVLYRPWLEEAALAFQKAVATHTLPKASPPDMPPAGTCLLFSDGLRYDLGQRLADALQAKGCTVARGWRFGALPGVTATAKPAVAPIAETLDAGTDFNVTHHGTRVTVEVLRRLLKDSGLSVLQGANTMAGDKPAWLEFGDLDRLGHTQGWKLAQRLDAEVRDLSTHITDLLDAGWQEVRVITDHGWLLMPDGLPKLDLPQHLTEKRKGRCARLKLGANTDQQTVPWHFDASVPVAVASGIGVYELGSDYEHGGLSVQECVLPTLSVTRPAGAPSTSVRIMDVRWTGLRCRVQVASAPAGTMVDLRTKAADPSTAVAQAPKALTEAGTASLVVPDDSLAGNPILLVLLDAAGTVLLTHATIVGEA